MPIDRSSLHGESRLKMAEFMEACVLL